MADITGTYPSSGELQGIISTASFIAGEVVGMRGPKGDKGDKGDTGDTGPQGAKGDTGATGAKGDTGDKGDKGDKGDTGNDGYSPSASVSKVGNKATITITDKDGTTTADIYDGTGSGTVTDVTQNGTSVLDGTIAKVSVPTKTSDLTNDAGFITGYTETDPTVPNWAKQANKPSYTASEVGALPDTTSIPSKTSDLTNDSDFVSGDVIADEYSASSTYAVCDYCVYNGQLYRCTTAISTAEAWTAAHWTMVTVAEELTDLKGDITQAVSTKQDTLVSGTNIKTINGNSVLGSGNLTISSATSTTVTLTSAGWSNSSQTVSVTGVTASNNVIVSPANASRDDYVDAGVWCYAQASGSLTFTCESDPSSDITVNVLILT